MTDKRQSDALHLADIADDGAWTFVIGVRKEIAAELRRQHVELETLRTGYAAARLEIESLLAAQPAGAPQPGTAYAELPKDVIREIFMAHGFTVKEGQTDLKEYVYDAAEALLQRASHGQAPVQPVATAGVSLARIIEEKIAAMTPSEASAFMAARAELVASGNDQAAPDMRDPYGGAREDLAIWRKRALEAEALNRKFATSVNGPTFMGEPAESDDALMAREMYESQDDSLLLCASDLQHSAIYDNHVEMQSCMRAAAARITALVHAAPKAEPAAQPDEDEALDLLEVLFDAWENGTPCYEDPETSDGFLGQAFRLDDAIFRRCADLLNRRRSNQIATTSPQAVDTQQAPAQAAPAHKDSTPELHIGDSAFESWYSTYSPAHKSDKQRASDAYAAGMGEPLVTATPTAVTGPSEAVAYLDIGAGGYLDLGTDLTDEALSRLPKGRHALVVAGTYGIDGYIAAPTTQAAPAAVARPRRATRAVQQLGAGDAVFAFASMLTALPRVVPFGSAAWATPGAELATAFNAANGLSVSLDFPSEIVFPKVDGDLLAVIEKAAAPQPASPSYTHADVLEAHPNGYELGMRQQDRATKPAPAAQGDALDAARLDWLENDVGCRVFHLGKSWYTRANFGMPYRKRASLREAIDAARKEMS